MREQLELIYVDVKIVGMILSSLNPLQYCFFKSSCLPLNAWSNVWNFDTIWKFLTVILNFDTALYMFISIDDVIRIRLV